MFCLTELLNEIKYVRFVQHWPIRQVFLFFFEWTPSTKEGEYAFIFVNLWDPVNTKDITIAIHAGESY